MIIFFKDDVVVLAEEFRSRKEKVEDAKLSDIEASSSTVTHYCDSIL